MSMRDTLIAARALIADKASWTQGTFARDVHGRSVEPKDYNATCWCAVGALEKVAPFPIVREISLLSLEAGGCIGNYNDKHTHEEVLEVFDKAIRILT